MRTCALFNPVMDEPPPNSILSRPSHRSWSMQRIAASLIIAVVSGAAGWLLHGNAALELLAKSPMSRLTENATLPALARQAAIAHVVYSPDMRHPVEIGADQEDQLVTWLSKRLGTPIRAPKLGKLGYEQIGGRLLPGQSCNTLNGHTLHACLQAPNHWGWTNKPKGDRNG